MSVVFCEVMVDGVAIAKAEGQKRQRRSMAEKRRIVELAMQPGASIGSAIIAAVRRATYIIGAVLYEWR